MDVSENLVKQAKLSMWGRKGLKAVSWSLLFLYLALASLLHVVDPFGWSAATGERSRVIMDRVISPWWGWNDGGWRVPADEKVSSVVLLEPVANDPWPPIFEKQGQTLAKIASMCPLQIVVDIIYDINREYYKTNLTDSLALIEDAAKDCARAPTLIFADNATPTPGENLIDEIVNFIGGPCSGGVFSKPRSDDCSNWMFRSYGVVVWDRTEKNEQSAYFDLDNDIYYRLLSNRWKYVDRLNTEENGGKPINSDRPSLTLAAYMNLCERLKEGLFGPRRSDENSVCEPSLLRDLAYARYDRTASGYKAAEQVPAEIADMLRKPISLAWPRWAPPESGLFQKFNRSDPSSAVDRLFGARGCVTDQTPRFLTRLGETFRLLGLAVLGSSPYARQSEVASCYPLMTFIAEPHLLMDCSEGCTQETQRLFNAQRDRDTGIAKYIRGLTVFVGFNTPDGSDKTNSPVHGTLPGVFHHAIAFENLVRFGDAYWTRPATNLTSFLGVIIGTDGFIEVTLLWISTTIAFYYRSRRWSANRRRMRVLDRLYRRGGWIQGRLRMLYVAASIFIRQSLLTFAFLFGATFICTVAMAIAFNWSISNWIAVGLLGVGALITLNVTVRRIEDAFPTRSITIVAPPRNRPQLAAPRQTWPE